MRHSRRHFSMGLAGIGLTAGFSARAQAPSQALIDAAKKEGSVVVYSGNAGNAAIGGNMKAFEAAYGIRVDLLAARANELRERIRSEQATGRFVADLSLNGQTTTILQTESGVFQPYGDVPNIQASRLQPEFAPNGTAVTAYAIGYALLVNNNEVKPGDEPKSWKDLADPKWKGRLLADDPRSVGGASHLFQVTHGRHGRDYHAAMSRQELQFTREYAIAARRVARGEFAIYYPQSLSTVKNLAGLPVRVVVPEEGLIYIPFQFAMFRNAPHPNAARLLLNFYLSEQVQLAHANVGDIVSVKGVAENAQPEMRALAGAKLFGTGDVRKQDELLALAKEIYK